MICCRACSKRDEFSNTVRTLQWREQLDVSRRGARWELLGAASCARPPSHCRIWVVQPHSALTPHCLAQHSNPLCHPQHEAKWTRRAIEFFNEAGEATASMPAAHNSTGVHTTDPVVGARSPACRLAPSLSPSAGPRPAWFCAARALPDARPAVGACIKPPPRSRAPPPPRPRLPRSCCTI